MKIYLAGLVIVLGLFASYWLHDNLSQLAGAITITISLISAVAALGIEEGTKKHGNN